MLNLKCLDTMCSLGSAPEDAGAAVSGFFYKDTRHLSAYSWTLEGGILLSRELEGGYGLEEVYSSPQRHKSDFVLIRRLGLRRDGFFDRLEVRNYGPETRRFELSLALDCDFRDLMGLRLSRGSLPELERRGNFEWRGRTMDSYELRTELSPSLPPSSVAAAAATWSIELPPWESATLHIQASFRSEAPHSSEPGFASLAGASASAREAGTEPRPSAALLDPRLFRSRFSRLLEAEKRYLPVLEKAIGDLHCLLHEEGGKLVFAAGLPHFDAPFGRDSLITAAFLLEELPEIAADTLRLAAALRGRKADPSRLEEPGKIFHEARRGELSRTGLIPFATYYGSVDATPLFLLLLGGYCRSRGDYSLLLELEEAWAEALAWIIHKLAEGRGFIRFSADSGPAGLKVQSWKDSPDSMSLPDGSPAAGPIAAGEVQAYAYGALRESVALAGRLGKAELAQRCAIEAEALAGRIRESFWLPAESCYALALDGEDRVLGSVSSNAGHFFAFQLESAEEAAAMADRLLRRDLFCGWGMRTLGTRAPRYNPLSYHNGSIWPHDNALVASGMYARGLRGPALRIAEALLGAVSRLEGSRAPELIAGFSEEEIGHPVSHPFACSPQAWAAAGVLKLAALRQACLGAEGTSSGGREP